MTSPSGSTSRRRLLQAGGLSAAAAAASAFASTPSRAATPTAGKAPKSKGGVVRDKLTMRKNGTFKIVQFNDTQDSHTTEVRTTELQEAVLDDVEPDFVLINGDCVNGDPDSSKKLKQAYNNVVLPMEERDIPWAVTMGNHDQDSLDKTGMTELKIMEFLTQYKYNLNIPVIDGVSGNGNQVITIRSSRSKKNVFALWFLDSGRYAPGEVADQDFEGYPTWGMPLFDQVEWYRQTSKELEQENKGLLPGLLFQHIPIWEYRFMWWGSVDERTEASHARAVERHSIVGERLEDEGTSPFNCGLFAAMQERGDIRGMFCGHEHNSDYVGNYYGIDLGYAANTGFGTYGLDGAKKNHMRGVRVFHLDEDEDGVYTKTEMKYARDYGIDVDDPEYRPGEPKPFPKGVS